MTYVTIALDNITLHGEDVDPLILETIGTIQNQYLEDNRVAIAKAISDLAIFGYCEMPQLCQ